MDIAIAKARLARMTASETEPVLAPEDLDALLEQFAIVDSFGALPTDPDWDSTWNLTGAAAEGWLWKSGRVSNRFDFGSDVQRFSRDQLFKHCMAMHDEYAKRQAASLDVGGWHEDWAIIGNLNGI